jgi:ribose transport system substrate-binding protein
LVLNTVAGHGAHSEQLAQVEAFIEMGADFVVISPTEPQAQVESIRKLHEAGIPFIVKNFPRPLTDEETGGAQPLSYIGHDHEVGGIITGEWTCRRAGGEPIDAAQILIFPGQANDLRSGGWRQVVEGCNVNIVTEINTEQAARDEGFAVAQSIIIGNPSVRFINAIASGMALGAQAGALELGRDDIDIVGFGGTVDELESILRGELAGSVTRMTDDVGVAMAEVVFLYFSDRADEIPFFYSGQYVMVDDETDPDTIRELLIYQNRYTGVPWDIFEPLLSEAENR